MIEAMTQHPVFFAVRAGHPLAGRGKPTATDTFGYPFVSLSRIAPRILEPMRAAQRKAVDPVAATRSFPAFECNALSAIKQVVLGSDAVMASTLTCIRAELERGEFTLLGSEPWLFLRYGIVALKGHPLSLASARFRDFIVEAERETCLEEEELLAHWTPVASRSRASRSRKRSRPGRGGNTGKAGTKRPATGL